MFWATVGVLVGCVALLIWLRGLFPDTSTKPLTSSARTARAESAGRTGAARATLGARSPGLKSTSQPFAALSVKPGANGCAAAADIGNVRFLEDAAPHLPLQGCDLLACNCTFQRHADRRREEQGERRGTGAVDSELVSEPGIDRRQLHGRRITDRS